MLETAIDWRLLAVVIPTLTLSSLSSGMCMTLSSRWLRQGRHRQNLDRATGSVLVGVGLWLMLD